MKNKNEAIGNLFWELEEANKVSVEPEQEAGPYSITVTYGPLLTIICCM